MVRGDRGIIAAIFGWLIFAGFISWDHQQQMKPAIYCDESTAPSDCRQQQYVTARAGIPGIIERAISNPEPGSGAEHEKRDLAAQEASAAFAFWMTLFAGMGTVVTAIGTILLYQQIILTRKAVEDTGLATDAMNEANKLAKENSHLELRAYLSVKSVTIAFDEWDADQCVFNAEVVNHGQTPALMQCVVFKAIWLHDGGLSLLIDYKANNTFKCHRDTPTTLPLQFSGAFDGIDREGRILVIGTIEYQDVFGKKQREQFGFQSPNLVEFQDIDLPCRLPAYSVDSLKAQIQSEQKQRADKQAKAKQ